MLTRTAIVHFNANLIAVEDVQAMQGETDAENDNDNNADQVYRLNQERQDVGGNITSNVPNVSQSSNASNAIHEGIPIHTIHGTNTTAGTVMFS